MKARELAEELMKTPDLDVVIGKDREGNDHSPCDGVQLGKYSPNTTWYGEWESVDHNPDIEVNAVVLFPVN